jgi:cytochrome b
MLRGQEGQMSVRVWDLPTRVFHWLLAVCVIGSITTAKIGGDAMEWHFRFGYVIFTLLAFRLLWGFVGGHWSRFASFVRWPGTIWRYLRGDHRPGDWFDIGHNPLGAWSVLAMLVFLVAQVATGLFADDEIVHTGPLAQHVSTATSLKLTAYHETVGQWVLIALFVLHVVAVVVYYRRGRDLVRPMISGDKLLPAGAPAAIDNLRTRVLAAMLALACGAGVAWLVSG